MEVYNSVLNSAKTVEGITESIDELESKLLADAQKLGFSNIDQVMNADISPLALVNPFSATEHRPRSVKFLSAIFAKPSHIANTCP